MLQAKQATESKHSYVILPFDLNVSEIILVFFEKLAKLQITAGLLSKLHVSNSSDKSGTVNETVFYSIKWKFCKSYSKINYGNKVANFNFFSTIFKSNIPSYFHCVFLNTTSYELV